MTYFCVLLAFFFLFFFLLAVRSFWLPISVCWRHLLAVDGRVSSPWSVTVAIIWNQNSQWTIFRGVFCRMGPLKIKTFIWCVAWNHLKEKIVSYKRQERQTILVHCLRFRLRFLFSIFCLFLTKLHIKHKIKWVMLSCGSDRSSIS